MASPDHARAAVGASTAFGLAVLVFAQIGCGGDGGSSCGTFTPCGGNVVGRWNVTDSCVSASAPPMVSGCQTQDVDASGLKMSGGSTFNADMTYSSEITVSGSVSATVPASCLMQAGITLTCEQVNALFLLSLIDNPDAPFSALSCTKAGSGCRCALTLKPTTGPVQGTYTTAGTLLTLTGADGSSDSSDYCVSGNKLQLKPSMMAGMGQMGGMDVTGLVVFTKQ